MTQAKRPANAWLASLSLWNIIIMTQASAESSALDAGRAQLLVAREAPHIVLAATQRWLTAVGYTEGEAVGRALALLLQGDGTCMVTAGALWSAVQVNGA